MILTEQTNSEIEMKNKQIKAHSMLNWNGLNFLRVCKPGFMASEVKLLWLVYFLFILCFAACTQAGGLLERVGSEVHFSFSTSATGSGEIVTRVGDGTSLQEGTTVRVLAYRRPNGSADAVLSQANYAGEAMYITDASGKLRSDSQPLQLIGGVYDFYAVTPALTVNHNGNEPSVSVAHRTDYAVSLTKGCSISTGGINNVSLATLQRRCSLLSFETDLKEGVTGISSVEIQNVSLTDMATEPQMTTGLNLLPATPGTTVLTLLERDFIYPDPGKMYQSKGEIVVLPKQEAPFTLTMNVCFNGGSVLTALTANLERIRFEAGNRYAFAIRFRQREDIYVELILMVSPWQEENLSTSMGEVGEVPMEVIVLGYWTPNESSASMGEIGNVDLPVGMLPQWTLNESNTSIGSLGNIDINAGVGDWDDCNGSYELGGY